MGDSSYKKRKKAEWIAAGLCRRCGREKQPDSPICPVCIRRDETRVYNDDYKNDNRNKPRSDGNYLYA